MIQHLYCRQALLPCRRYLGSTQGLNYLRQYIVPPCMARRYIASGMTAEICMLNGSEGQCWYMQRKQQCDHECMSSIGLLCRSGPQTSRLKAHPTQHLCQEVMICAYHQACVLFCPKLTSTEAIAVHAAASIIMHMLPDAQLCPLLEICTHMIEPQSCM